MSNPLASPADYSLFIQELLQRYTYIEHSSLVYIPLGAQFGKATGMVFFANNIILCVQEFLNFELQVIEGYGYEVSRCLLPSDHLPLTTAGPHTLTKRSYIGMTCFHTLTTLY